MCARLLGKAADIRERMRLPLVSFWVAYDKEAAQTVRAAIGNGRFDSLYRAGATTRDELVFDEARAFLHEVAEGYALAADPPPALDVPTNRPSGS